MNSNKKILVTGGAGFLGSHLCERLLAEDYKVICLDNLFTGNMANIEHLKNNPNFDMMRHDITEPMLLDVDEIYNLACPASPIHYQHDPIHTTKTSVIGILNILGIAKRTGARVMHASTSEVYGDPEIHPQPETYWGNVHTTGIRSCYDEGKRCAESLCFDYRRKHNVIVKVARIFNTYGPQMHPEDGRVVSNFIVQGLKNEPITVYGGGEQTRSFCYVDDMIDGFIILMNSDDSFSGPVNLGNPNEFTIHELADKVIEHTNSSSTIEHLPLPEDDPKQRKPDITLAISKLNWSPKIQLDEGLDKTIPYFRSFHDQAR